MGAEERSLAFRPLVAREMNRDADKLVEQAFKGEPLTHATD